jgi:hypothetical protein
VVFKILRVAGPCNRHSSGQRACHPPG